MVHRKERGPYFRAGCFEAVNVVSYSSVRAEFWRSSFNEITELRGTAEAMHRIGARLLGKKRLAHQLPGGEHGGIAPFPQQVLNPSLSLSIEEGFEVCPQGSPITRPSEVVRGELPLLVSPKSNAGARELGELGPYSASGRIPPDEEGASSIHSAESSEDL